MTNPLHSVVIIYSLKYAIASQWYLLVYFIILDNNLHFFILLFIKKISIYIGNQHINKNGTKWGHL